MDTFKNFVKKEEKGPTFCYMIYPEGKFLEELVTLQKSLNLQDAELVPPEKFHCTIRYVKLTGDQNPKAFTEWLSAQQLPIVEAFTCKFSQFNEGALVAELDSQGLQDYFNKINGWMVESGGFAQSDFPTYKPHISLAYGVKGDAPLFEVDKHRMNVKFTVHKVTNAEKQPIFYSKPQEYKGLVY
jgi:hypothetical protein